MFKTFQDKKANPSSSQKPLPKPTCTSQLVLSGKVPSKNVPLKSSTSNKVPTLCINKLPPNKLPTSKAQVTSKTNKSQDTSFLKAKTKEGAFSSSKTQT